MQTPNELFAALPISGYVLAGGHSSRMGAEKALLRLADHPLIAHAAAKLRRICAHTYILSSNPNLASFAPLVPDIHPNNGPIGGIEVALAHSVTDWNMILPVDVPFLPASFLHTWASSLLSHSHTTARIALFSLDGIPQPTVLMIHRDASPFISESIARGDRKLFPILEEAALNLAAQRNLASSALVRLETCATNELWFHNLNTPEDFALAQSNAALLDDDATRTAPSLQDDAS